MRAKVPGFLAHACIKLINQYVLSDSKQNPLRSAWDFVLLV